MTASAFAALLLAATAGDVLPVDADWPVVARDADGRCRLTITGEGRFFRIAATGLGAGAAARYRLTNGDMEPIDWTVEADEDGSFARYYLPFRWEAEDGGVVQVNLTSARCNLRGSFAWRPAQAASD